MRIIFCLTLLGQVTWRKVMDFYPHRLLILVHWLPRCRYRFAHTQKLNVSNSHHQWMKTYEHLLVNFYQDFITDQHNVSLVATYVLIDSGQSG